MLVLDGQVPCGQERNYYVYNFICVACVSEGELKVMKDYYMPFGCPGGCRASYVQHLVGPGLEVRLRYIERPVIYKRKGAKP
jgi:hypothetical protein